MRLVAHILPVGKQNMVLYTGRENMSICQLCGVMHIDPAVSEVSK